MAIVPVCVQTLVEYGAITSGLAAFRNSVEVYIGQGHLKYLLLALLCLVVLLWLRPRR